MLDFISILQLLAHNVIFSWSLKNRRYKELSHKQNTFSLLVSEN